MPYPLAEDSSKTRLIQRITEARALAAKASTRVNERLCEQQRNVGGGLSATLTLPDFGRVARHTPRKTAAVKLLRKIVHSSIT
jgi:hypothetical protein